MNLEQIADKTDITVANLSSNGGYLTTEQESAFIRKLTDYPTILTNTRKVVMSGPKREINKIGFGGRILRKAPTSAVPMLAAQRSAPTSSKIALETSKVWAEINIPYDVLEDNIERGGLENTIMDLITSQSAIDLEELLIWGNDAGSGALWNGSTYEEDNGFLQTFDGIVALATENGVDVTGASSAFGKDKFKLAIQAMPPKYMRNKPAMRWYLSHNNETEWRDIIADRETIVGDSALEGSRPIRVQGVSGEACTMMPDTHMILANPQNFVWGIQRGIMIETERDIRSQNHIIVVSMRVAFEIEETEAVVVVEGIGEL